MLEAFKDLNDRIDRAELRVRRPHQTVFLCGGLIDREPNSPRILSVRDYIFRWKDGQQKINADIVLAETAQQLYRDTRYSDLISFEEDIAKIASIVLVITESPGSLAELGAFASIEVIRETLRIIMSEEHGRAESFVRYGPVRRIENIDRQRVGIFPWRKHKKSGLIVKASINPHFYEIVHWINEHISACPESFRYSNTPDKALFYDILWILSLVEACPPEPLYNAVRVMHPECTDLEIKNKLYVLKTCRWLDYFSYGGRDYFFLRENRDPYEYSFRQGHRPRDVAAFKLAIAREFRQGSGVTPAVIKRLQEIRGDGA